MDRVFGTFFSQANSGVAVVVLLLCVLWWVGSVCCDPFLPGPNTSAALSFSPSTLQIG